MCFTIKAIMVACRGCPNCLILRDRSLITIMGGPLGRRGGAYFSRIRGGGASIFRASSEGGRLFFVDEK